VELLETRLALSGVGAAQPTMLKAPVAPPAALGREAARAAVVHDPGKAAQAAEVALKLHGELTAVPVAPPRVISANPLVVVQVNSFSGHLDPLGDVHGTCTLTINETAGTFTASSIMQTTQGDTITATHTGILIPTADKAVVDYAEVVTITGGTGRFAGATGVIYGEGQVNTSTGIDHEQLWGVLVLAPAHGPGHALVAKG
jgi:hypothetical protein